ncbi:MAG: tetratricopeptide repeat protein [Candidatus Sulfotelmatobacter sp.]
MMSTLATIGFRMRRCGALALVVGWLASFAVAQIPPNAPGNASRDPKYVPEMSSYDSAPGTGVLVFHVFAQEKGAHVEGPVRLDLTNLANHIGLFQTVEGDTDGVFVNLAFGNYEIEVSALGYLASRQEVQVVSTIHPEPIDIVLGRDPAAINLDVSPEVIPPKARKNVRQAVSQLKIGELAEAEKHLQTAYKLAPSNSDLNFLLGYLYFQRRNYAQAGTYLTAAASLGPHNAQALTLLGRVDLAREDYPAARSALEQAVLADDDNWLPHSLLADTYLRQKEYRKARDEAQISITKGRRQGKTTVGPAELVLAQAFIGLGRKQEAIQELEVFLRDSPQNPMVYQVKNLIEELKKHNSSSAADGNTKTSAIDTSRVDPLGAVHDPALTTQTWRPPDVDDTKPPLTPGVMCPASDVIDGAGKRVEELVRDLARFAANEELFHQSIDAFGFATHTEKRSYDYVAIVSKSEAGNVSIEEYRSDKPHQEGYPDNIASTGFIALALVFHPDMQKDFDFDCEGQAEWHGQPSWLVHFRQRHDRPNRMHSYSLGGQGFPVDLKGRAWITADKFQIVRIEADMIKPMPEIQLLSEHQTVEYGPVPFPKKNTTLWLPKSAEIYFDFRKHRYYRRHAFDHFLLFSVDTEDKQKTPATKPDDNPGKPAVDTSS